MFESVQAMIGLRPKLREAESADARLDMKARKNTLVRRYGLKQIDEHAVPQAEDQDTVSVKSTLMFLEGFLESRLDRMARSGDPDYPAWVPSNKASNQNTTLASLAYRHAAEISQIGEQRKPQNNQSRELKVIYQLITGLREMADKGIETLKIDSGKSFLDALADVLERERRV